MSETEKITINLGLVDLGQIDLLVREGFYQNRTDFIRTAIRNQIGEHAEAVKQTVVRKELVLGLQHYTRSDLEAVRAEVSSSASRRWFSQPDSVSSDGKTRMPRDRANAWRVRSSRLARRPQASMVTHWAATMSIRYAWASSVAQEDGS